MDNYYSVKLKKLRVSKLKKFKNFKYFNKDITNRANLINFFKKKKFDIIFHLAAQAGVRYSNKQPKKYIKTNKYRITVEIKKVKNFRFLPSDFIYTLSA